MNEEQTTVRAIVRELEKDMALVEIEQGGCGRCHEAGGCGGQSLTRMMCGGAKQYRVANDIGAAVGVRVNVAIALASVRQGANLGYVLPLTASIAGAALGMQLGDDPGAMLGGAFGLLVAFLYVRHRMASGVGFSGNQPHIVSRSS